MFGSLTNGTHSLNRLRNEMDRLFGDVLVGNLNWSSLQPGSIAGYPALNVWETDDALHAEAEMPGLKSENIEIAVIGRELTIKGERAPETLPDATWHRRERATGAFARVLRLPFDVDSEKVTAAFKDGVLCVTLPKAAAARPRKIEVKTESK